MTPISLAQIDEERASGRAANHALVVTMTGIAKSFGATRAVDGVDLELRSGEVHGLVGENGAGKSTLMRILAGSFSDYDGAIAIAGIETDIRTPAQARAAGIALVHQELSLLPELTVAENIFLGREPAGAIPGFISRSSVEREARRVLAKTGIDLSPSAKVDRLSIAERQLVEIVKGISASPRVLILDEPTSSLTIRETRELFSIVKRLVATKDTAIVYISHKLHEIFVIADRVSVLRDGRKVLSAPIADWTEAKLVRAMVGRDLSALFPHSSAVPGAVRLEVIKLARRGTFGPLSFSIRAGEIVGLYGIVGAGRSELGEAIFGLSPADSGTIHVDGRAVSVRSPAKALAFGIAMSPEDRHTQGLVPMLSAGENISLSALPQFVFAGFVKRRAERAAVQEFLRRLLVRLQSAAQEVAALSGGNQQKIVLGRSLMPGPKVLILDEPTRGIDVVAKAEVHNIIDRLAHEGLAVLLISSELPEILGMSDRILVMRGGALEGSLDRGTASEERLVAMVAGVRHDG
jgi:rhamnose transport system ATP-binding protein